MLSQPEQNLPNVFSELLTASSSLKAHVYADNFCYIQKDLKHCLVIILQGSFSDGECREDV